MAKKGKKKVENPAKNENHGNMKIVTSSTCQICRQQCQRGLDYMERMAKPGAIGYGVPCILTKGKA